MSLKPGLYESIVTEALARSLDDRAELRDLSKSEAARRLAGRFSEHLLGALGSLPKDGRPGSQVALVNELVAVVERHARGFSLQDDGVQAALLTGIHAADNTPLPPRPQLPLSESGLYINANREQRLDLALSLEIQSADRIDMICAFLFWTGYRALRPALRAHLAAGRPLRVLTTVYGGMTQSRVLDELVELGAEVKLSYETGSTRLHAKAWLLHRDSGFSTAFVGSSNLSHAALTSGLEWNVRLSSVENAGVFRELEGAFNNHWEDSEFFDYDPEQFAAALDAQRGPHLRAVFALSPRPFQAAVLERLSTERELHDRHRNLVVAATGTGKTVIAALDYRALCARAGRRLRLLFVAHRREILQQSLHTFCHALSDGSFGELFVDGQRPHRGEHVFASIQSLSRSDLARWAPDHFEVVIVDEFHHAAADTYTRLLERLQPAELLGLTATPERNDGRSVLEWFDGRIASELRLWDAIERGFLVPFQYLAVADGTDLRSAWKRGRYDLAALGNLYTGHHRRAHLIIEALGEHIGDPTAMRAIAFCVSIAHAEFMTEALNEAGVASAVVTGRTSKAERDHAIRALRDGQLSCVVTVDVFNEGVDIPEIDTVLFMRPTESATVFLQQLGRGLRRAEGKRCLTVLDFVGQPHDRFRYADRFRALLGRMGRRELKRQVEHGFPFLPSGCSIELDSRSQEIILDNVSRSLRLDRRSLAAELRDSGARDLRGFLESAGLEPTDLYRGGRTFSELARIVGLPIAAAGPQEAALGRGLARLLHVDDQSRLRAWKRWLQGRAEDGDCPRALQLMLMTTLWGPDCAGDLVAAARNLWEHEALHAELLQLLDVLAGDLSHRTMSFVHAARLPFQLHATYRLNEVMAGLGDVRKGRLYLPREGVHFDVPSECNLLFVTIQKEEADYSSSTMYADYAMGPARFHWQSQSGTRPTDKKGLRHVEHETRGITPLLFVREYKKDDRNETMPYRFLGPVRLESWSGARPMDVVWELQTEMPAEVLQVSRVVG
jgi:superfamily II DNA or RNA helicase